MAHKLEIQLTFQLKSPVHITGERAELYIDKALLLDAQAQYPLIPATTIKGWLRESSERHLRGWGVQVCDGSKANLMCGHCLVCQLFGAPQHRALLRFSDAVLRDGVRDVRMNVSLSRFRRASFEERLFSTELAWASGFSCQLDGILPDVERARQAAALIYVAARMGFALGAARSRGLGWVCLDQFQANCDGQILAIQDLLAYLPTMIRALQGTSA
ncbi:MAG: RAMP superfamily CRISPR-associated protein [Gemmatales bacterium]|nr:RAMP superfamily CRISPR-associated protein [Gemmatales bacterium]MDW8174945.1 RAMP superfamily CRISPR-associated protein [Gemmatales bacterium]